jgi:hypothetical protein
LRREEVFAFLTELFLKFEFSDRRNFIGHSSVLHKAPWFGQRALHFRGRLPGFSVGLRSAHVASNGVQLMNSVPVASRPAHRGGYSAARQEACSWQR